MRKTIVKWLILTLLIAYATCVTIWAHGEANNYVCKGIDVIIQNTVAPDTITRHGVLNELSHFPKKIIGAPVESLNTKEIESFLSRYSNFESVDCVLETDARLSVRIIPMIPAMRIFDGSKSYYINKDGKKIESKASFFVDVPVVTGNFSEKISPKGLLPVTRFIENDPVLSKLIAMIEVKDADNIFLIPRIHGHVINLGDTTRLNEKRAAIVAMYRKVMPYKGWETYDTISVKFRGQVVASRRDKLGGNHGAILDEDIDPDEATLSELYDIGAE
ncbi:MAG: hypothetical protein K2J82_08680 [Muribaculaceae bacterium]|nr:hypothetical protein [Muribaculaceae bacterium]